MNLYNYTKDEILSTVKEQRDLSMNYFSEKREIFRDRIRLINGQDKGKDKVNINIASSTINTLIALNYQDELTVKFLPRSIEDFDTVDLLDDLSKFDFEEMGLDSKNYQKEFDRLFYGVSIRVFEGFNDKLVTPIVTVVDPLSWYCDPYPKGFTADDFRWHGFEKDVTISDLKEKGYNTQDLVKDISQERYLDITKRNEASKYNTQKDNTKNKKITVYYHYFQKDGNICLAIVDSDVTTLLDFMQLDIKLYPVILNYFKPRKDDPCGDSVMDYVEDKQRAESKLFNLMVLKATQESLGGDFIYNTNKIKNRADLEKSSVTKRYIGINLNPGEGIGEVIQQVPRDRLNVDVESMRQALRREVQYSTGIDNIIQGIRGDKSITARESQTIQQNANLNLALNNKVNSWGEKDFWYKWFLYYKEYMASSDEKIIRIHTGLTSRIQRLRKHDFVTAKDLDISILNKSDKQAEIEQDRLNIPHYQILLQNPELSSFEKILLNRHILRISGSPQYIIDSVFSPTYEEETAKFELELLNKNEPIGYIDPTEDQKTYLIIYKNGLNTKEMRKTKAIRERIYIEQLKQKRQLIQPQAQQEQKGIGQALNMSMANSLSQQRKGTEATSLQNIVQ